MTAKALSGRVALVAGATRGAGRGIAAALGEAGATVICTGRSTGAQRSEYDRPETIEETAELVTRLGGKGIAHLEIAQVRALAERVKKDHRKLDVLVNDIWGGEVLKGGPSDWNKPIWQVDLDAGLRILRLAIDTHLITSHCLAPLLVEQPGGLLVEVTDGTAAYNASHYRISVFYDLAKVAVARLAFSQGHELKAFGATASACRRRPGAKRCSALPVPTSRRRRPILLCPSHLVTSVAPWRRSRQTKAARVGTSNRSARVSWRASMASPT
jgi:NAD(P)-dependent dehydrogenase (short-subunit alcohol dehydrogenase family)